MKLAVIDLGTNTCNLLISKISDKEYQILYQGKIGVKIGKAGIHKKLLTREAFERARLALKKHQQTIRKFKVDQIVAIATSAVRDAENQDNFIQSLLKETGIQLQVISGEEEAHLIFEGVKLALGKINNNSLILDIGGGSNEFILTNDNQIAWKKSFPLGMSRIIEQFKISDPIQSEEIRMIENYFESGLNSFWQTSLNMSINQLIGCSGAFDTLADLIDQTTPGSKSRIRQEISVAEFERVCQQVIHSTKAHREQMIGMEQLRVEMIVPSFLFIRLIIKKLKIKNIIQTDYALREGVLYESIND